MNFPHSVGRERVRQFRPDQVREWIKVQAESNLNMITLEEVCKRVGISRKAYRRWMKEGHAPTPCRREMGSGAYLWDEKEFDEWLERDAGGFARSKVVSSPPRIQKAKNRSRRGPRHHEKLMAAAL
jgi:predicted DNA-binding transcriptional regulator AlpA